jgi:uncharacterized membrane-anchored protein
MMTVNLHPAEQVSSDLGPVEVPLVTVVFWLIKILATTVGETDGDAGAGTEAGRRSLVIMDAAEMIVVATWERCQHWYRIQS